MILSDSALRQALNSGELVVVDELGITHRSEGDAPELDEQCVQPASIDLHLGAEFAFWETERDVINFALPADSFPPMKHIHTRGIFAMQPHAFVLATTAERIHVGPRYVGRVEGKSSLGRAGLVVHATAGFIDPGFDGTVTLELYNLSPHWMQIVPGQPICQLAIEEVIGNVERPYGDKRLGSKYSGQRGVTLSRWKGMRQ